MSDPLELDFSVGKAIGFEAMIVSLPYSTDIEYAIFAWQQFWTRDTIHRVWPGGINQSVYPVLRMMPVGDNYEWQACLELRIKPDVLFQESDSIPRIQSLFSAFGTLPVAICNCIVEADKRHEAKP